MHSCLTYCKQYKEKKIQHLLNKCVIARKLGGVVQIKAVYIFVETA